MSLAFRNRQQQQPVYVEQEDLSDAEPMPEKVGGELAKDVDVQQHLTKDMFAKPQDIIIDFDLIASPSELSATLQNSKWRMSSFLLSNFKQNMAVSNRHLATADQLAGNLNRCIPLHMQIIEHQNTFPFAMGVNITGMMPTTVHRHGACVWRVPAGTNTMKVDEPAFVPQNIVNQYMYANYRMCTVEDLSSDLQRIEPKKGGAHYSMAVGSLAHNELITHLNKGGWHDHFTESELALIDEPGRTPTIAIPEAVGKELYEMLKGPVEEAANSFVDLETFCAEFVRADGISEFNSPKNIAGEIVGSDKVSGTKLNTDRMLTRSSFHVKAKLT